MSKSSDYFCGLFIIISIIVQIGLSFSAGEMFWIYVIGIVVELFILLLYHYVAKDELSKKWEMKKR